MSNDTVTINADESTVTINTVEPTITIVSDTSGIVGPMGPEPDLSDIISRIEQLEANQLPSGEEGNILLYQGGAWGATDTLPT